MFALQITRSVTSGVSAGDTGRHMGHEYEFSLSDSSGNVASARNTQAKTRPLGPEYIPSEDVASARKTQAKTLPLGDEYEYEFSTSTEEVIGHGWYFREE